MAENSKVLVVIVHWGDVSVTLKCLESISVSTYKDFSVFLFDNSDGDMEDHFPKFEFPIIYQKAENIGYAAGVNKGFDYFQKSNFSYIMLLNNDTILKPESLSLLVEYMDSESSVGAAAPTILYHYDKSKIWSNGGDIFWDNGSTRMITVPKDAAFEPDFLTGCALLIRRDAVIDETLVSEKLSAYFEDADLSMRIKRRGYKIILLPYSIIYHDIRDIDRETAPHVIYLMARNRIFFFSEYLAGIQKWFVLLKIIARNLRSAAAFLIKPSYKQSRYRGKYILLGLKDAVFKQYYMGTFK